MTYGLVAAVLVIGGSLSGAQEAHASDSPAEELDFCTCVNEPMDTDERIEACIKLMDSMPAEEMSKRTVACRAAIPVPEGGADICYCLRAVGSDPKVQKLCKGVVPKEWTAREMFEKSNECARKEKNE